MPETLEGQVRIVPRGPATHQSDGSPLGWLLLRQRMFGGDGSPVTLPEMLTAWRRDARAVIDGERL
ncbi:MAG: hypothetical protein WA210_00870 [Burkholderiaceae bacterium]